MATAGAEGAPPLPVPAPDPTPVEVPVPVPVPRMGDGEMRPVALAAARRMPAGMEFACRSAPASRALLMGEYLRHGKRSETPDTHTAAHTTPLGQHATTHEPRLQAAGERTGHGHLTTLHVSTPARGAD